MRECAKLANEAVASGMCCVIGLQSTGEANTNQTRDEEGDSMDDFVSAPKRILQLFLTKHFPTDHCDMDTHGLDLLQHQVTCMIPAACHHALICLFPLTVSKCAFDIDQGHCKFAHLCSPQLM